MRGEDWGGIRKGVGWVVRVKGWAGEVATGQRVQLGEVSVGYCRVGSNGLLLFRYGSVRLDSG